MSKMREFLTENKTKLLSEKRFYEALLCRHAVKGYVSEKNIRGKKSQYLQLRNDYYKLISIYLTPGRRKIIEMDQRGKAQIKKKLSEVNTDLALLEAVPVAGNDNSRVTNIGGVKLLDGATGISRFYHILFYLSATGNPGFYTIHFFGKKKEHEIPMTYVWEDHPERILSYVESAGAMIDDYVRKTDDPDLNKSMTKEFTGFAKSKGEIKFHYSESGDHYILTYEKDHGAYSTEYKPVNTGEIDFMEIIYMGFLVDRYDKKQSFRAKVRELYGE